MKKFDKRTLDEASMDLKLVLEKVLGPSLPGVAGFGPRLDLKSDEMLLNVMVNPRAGKRLRQKLPPSIRGVKVQVAPAGRGYLG